MRAVWRRAFNEPCATLWRRIYSINRACYEPRDSSAERGHIVSSGIGGKEMQNSKKRKAPRGLACRKCGGRVLKVVYTRHRDGYVLRRRECTACNTRMVTRERASADDVPVRTPETEK